jgi:succinate dehydrogenase/fumarate reductase flavoprotein subunit
MAAEIAAVSDSRSMPGAGEHKLSADMARRARAEALLQDDLLQEAFARLEERYIEEWRVSQFRDTDARERLWQAVNILRKVKDHLAKIVRDGKLAQREIDQLAEKRKRFGIG